MSAHKGPPKRRPFVFVRQTTARLHHAGPGTSAEIPLQSLDVIRLATVLFVSLAVQLSAATAPFVHQHGEAVVHRHLAPHAEAPEDHDKDGDHHEAAAWAHGGHDFTLTYSGAGVSAAAGVMSARHETAAPPNVPDARAVEIHPPLHGAQSPDRDVGSPVPHAPDLASAVLRGPPR